MQGFPPLSYWRIVADLLVNDCHIERCSSKYTDSTIECSSSTSCTVICNNGTTTCNNQVINGHAATSLTVYCGSQTCSNLSVSCPGAGCTIDCVGDNSCNSANIHYNGTTDDDGVVSLNCHSGHYACYEMTVDTPTVHELNINCTAEFESFNYACKSIVVDANSAETVHLHSAESHGSGYSIFNVSNAHTVTLYARGYRMYSLMISHYCIFCENTTSLIHINI